MPGLSQLKQFSSDLLALGDEVATRAARGEQPLKVEIPSSIEDINDSEEFVLGMPEVEAEVEDDFIDDDLSELAGLGDSTSNQGSEDESGSVSGASFDAPDLSGLLNPLEDGDFGGGNVPDLSMFADEPEDIEEENIQEEPEEVSIADMGLEDLLSGGGFDQPEESSENGDDQEQFSNLENTIPDANLEPVTENNFENDLSGLDDDLNLVGDVVSLEDLDEDDKLNINNDLSSNENIALDEKLPLNEDFDFNAETTAEESQDNNDSDFTIPDFDSVKFDNIGSGVVPDAAEDIADESMEFSTEDFDEPVANIDLEQPIETDTSSEVDMAINSDAETSSIDDVNDFNVDNLDDLNLPDFDNNLESNSESNDDIDTSIPAGLFDADDVELSTNVENEGADSEDSKDIDASLSEISDLPDLDTSLNDFTSLEDISETPSNEDNNEESETEPLEIFDTSEMEGIDFDDMPDTDTILSQGADNDSQYDLKSDDAFNLGSEFEIPGFSDVETVKEQKSGKIGGKDSKDKKNKAKKHVNKEDGVAVEDEDNLPPNTLSDRQYKIFKKNLSEYPLNVRLAFEDFLVQDEFTDDAEFEVIEKILNRAPARQVASTLEKMLDISIPVPRDFEHRSAEEYEEYKKSISYQLKNKIIPAALIFIVGIFVCMGVFNFSKNCIYKPLKANGLYKQGYVLLQESEYPLSEIKFNQAASYRLNKKWFFKYARGYREHKQYQRAGKMYENILYCFKHDKKAGLEYADMELEDLANYSRAEEIVRREVLDYHINDADGILKLGDVFLEWGTEKDPAKLEQAREQYATLLQLYGQKDLYLSRMMRYFIRSDNLRETLQLKQHFEPKEDSLCSDDWTELSGYLLNKYYGELAPSEEYLRYEIEGLRGLLLRAVSSNPNNPVALYNLSKYFINTNENEYIESTLQASIEKFNAAKKMKKRDIYKYIDAYRLLGEHYMETEDFLQSQEQFAEGISLYVTERDHAGFEGNAQIGKLYEDMGDLKYTISGDYDEALQNYTNSVKLENDSPKIRYRIGYIQYNNKNYGEALGSFMRAGDGHIKERNLLLAMANTLSLRGDDYAAEGYYNQLIETLDTQIAEKGIILPQANVKDYDVVNTYLSAANNYGVTLYRLAKKTGDSGKNAQAIVQFSQSVRAWDALTRNQETMIRLPGSNLAEQNIKYITHPVPEFEPAIYTGISKTLLDNEKL